MDSILESVKKNLGLTAEYTHFDEDIIMHINSTFMLLHQLGVGPENGLIITDEGNTWSEFTTEQGNVELVKSYVYLRVRLLFDPPSSSVMMDAMKEQIREFEWRLNVAVESSF